MYSILKAFYSIKNIFIVFFIFRSTVIQEDSATTKDEAQRMMEQNRQLMDDVDRQQQEAEQMLESGIREQQKADELLADADGAKAIAEVKWFNTLGQLIFWWRNIGGHRLSSGPARGGGCGALFT